MACAGHVIYTQAMPRLRHDVPGTGRLETNLSRAAGVPDFMNHIAFAVATADELARRKARWLAAGRDVTEIDHG